MSENDGTFSKLMELAETVPSDPPQKPARRSDTSAPVPKSPESPESAEPTEDLNTTPYISQNYRFTEDELRWLKRQSYDLSEHFGTKISQNMVLRVALHDLRQTCEKNPALNPLLKSISRLKK